MVIGRLVPRVRKAGVRCASHGSTTSEEHSTRTHAYAIYATSGRCGLGKAAAKKKTRAYAYRTNDPARVTCAFIAQRSRHIIIDIIDHRSYRSPIDQRRMRACCAARQRAAS